MSTLVEDYFQPGETLVICHPWISSVNLGLRDSVCANCFNHVSKISQPGSMKRCSSCKAVSYCGVKCQEAHWKEEHKVECGFMKRLIGSKEGKLLFPSQQIGGVIQGILGDKDSMQLTRKMMVLKVVNKILRGSTNDPEFPAKFETFLAVKYGSNARPAPAVEPVAERNGFTQEDGGLGELEREYRSMIMAAFGLTKEEYRDKLGSKYNFEGFYQRFRCSGTSENLREIPEMTVAETFVLETAQLDVSCEPNATVDGQSKTFVIRALEPIPKPLRLADCRITIHTRTMEFYPFPAELELVVPRLGRPCSGKYCTPEYHAEMLPLRCANTSCDQPLPSDDRALQPCPKCGSVLQQDRLMTGNLRLDELRTLYNDVSRPAVERISQLRTDPVIHPENLFAVLVITGSLDQLADQPGYLWSTARLMLPFIRKCYPKNDWYLAALLEAVASDYKHVAKKSDRQLEEGKKMLREAYEIQVRCGWRGDFDIGQACTWYEWS